MMRDRFQILFIIFVSLGIYYPSLFGGFNTVDDEKMITALLNTEKINFKEIFLPGHPFHYYRPVLWLSFLLDAFVFNCHEFYMHLHNAVLHTLNAVLVFLIAKESINFFWPSATDQSIRAYIPLFSSLLFIVHPINTEAVNWISGRTDVLAGFFVLFGFYLFLKKGIHKYLWCWVAAVLYLCGLLSKEVAIGLLPVILIFLFLKENGIKRLDLKQKALYLIPFLSITIFYFLLRKLASGYSDLGISAVSTKLSENKDFVTLIGSGIKATGFYIKKLFIPLPLNFGIIEINRTLYLWLGIISIILLCYLYITYRNLFVFYVFWSVIFLIPALPVAISVLAWTPLAERYLYISSSGFSIFLTLSINRFVGNKTFIFLMLSVLLFSSIITVNRNIIWQDNLSLYEDTVRKSPNFAPARNEYGIALLRKGKYDEAREQFLMAKGLVGDVKYKYIPEYNLILLSNLNKKSEEKKENLLKLLNTVHDTDLSSKILKDIIKITDGQLRKEKNGRIKKQLLQEEIKYYQRLLQLENDNFYNYRIGQLYLAIGDKKEALKYFKKVIEKSSVEVYYVKTAQILIRRIEK